MSSLLSSMVHIRLSLFPERQTHDGTILRTFGVKEISVVLGSKSISLFLKYLYVPCMCILDSFEQQMILSSLPPKQYHFHSTLKT